VKFHIPVSNDRREQFSRLVETTAAGLTSGCRYIDARLRYELPSSPGSPTADVMLSDVIPVWPLANLRLPCHKCDRSLPAAGHSQSWCWLPNLACCRNLRCCIYTNLSVVFLPLLTRA
jgi:hypothetical protein